MVARVGVAALPFAATAPCMSEKATCMERPDRRAGPVGPLAKRSARVFGSAGGAPQGRTHQCSTAGTLRAIIQRFWARRDWQSQPKNSMPLRCRSSKVRARAGSS